AARRIAGDVPAAVVLPPEPVELPNVLSPICTVISLGFSPRTSAATIAVTVRWPVPRSWEPDWTSTDPSALMVTLVGLGPRPPPPQVWIPMPRPVLMTPSPRPGGCQALSQLHILRTSPIC